MLEPPLVLDGIEDLLAGAGPATPLDTVGKSGALLERVEIEGEAYVVKHLDLDGDWTLRAAGLAEPPTLVLWRRGLLAALPECIAQPIVAVARDRTNPRRFALLMHDIGEHLVPSTDDGIDLATHEKFLDHMAAMHARFWHTEHDIDVVTAERRYLMLSPRMAAEETALGSPSLVPRLVAEGWSLLPEVAPAAAEIVVPLVHEPGPLLTAIGATPQTFVHSDWKLDNLGLDPAGRTILLDWELPGRGAPTSDLAWYLAINCRRIPTSKEAAIEHYRDRLEAHGTPTADWWDVQLPLSLLGALVQFGWEKALGGYDEELAWWEEQAVLARRLL